MGVAQDWLNAFEKAITAGDANDIGALFETESFWRDYLPFDWTLQTTEGRDAIAAFGARTGPTAGFANPQFEEDTEAQEGLFRFATKDGTGRGHVQLENGVCKTLFTMLEHLPDAAEPADGQADPFVLIVGGGQGGLALGAQLQDLRVPYLIVDKYPKVGDQWRSRYDSLVLHDPVWYDHMPFKPFPADWPVFTPKDQMGDWLEAYAEDLNLNVSTNTSLIGAQYDAASAQWTAQIDQNGARKTVQPTHLVMALGLSGFPKVPSFKGQDTFQGPQCHSSEFQGGTDFAGKNVIVVGANNSAHDIASDLVRVGGKPTMIQRSSTLVVDQTDYCERILGPLYSEKALENGISTDKADILQASMPLRMMERNHKELWDGIRADRAEFYQRLTDVGFAVDFAEDGTGLGMKYRRTASGYYIDVGGAQMVMDGQIKVRSGSGVSHLSEHAVHLDNGETLPADAVVYATGYGDMTDWVAALVDPETADRVGPCWGYGSGTKGDPGPWIGEQRNIWVETGQQGLWITGGNLSQARFFSRLLALQLARRFS